MKITNVEHTANFKDIEKFDKRTLLTVSEAIFTPLVLVERCYYLVRDLIEKYFEDANLTELRYDAENRSKCLSAQMYSIQHQLDEAMEMFNEIERYPGCDAVSEDS